VLTLKTCFDAIDHKLGTSPEQPLDRLNIVNQAGAILYAHPWRWLEAGLWELSLEQGSDRVTLPDDVGEIVDITPADSWQISVNYLRDLGTFQRVRAANPEATSSSCFTLAPFNEMRRNVSKSYLAVWPPASEPMANALLCFGRRRWGQMTDEDKPESAYVPLPKALPILETLFIELVRAYAAGYEKDVTTDVQEQIARVMGGPLWLMALEADSRTFSGSSPMRNTGMQMAKRRGGGYGGDQYNGPQTWVGFP